jgi:hypothetical protein
MIPSYRLPRSLRIAATACMALVLAGCPDQPAEEEALPPSEALPLALALEPPSRLGTDETNLRITLTNEGDDPVAGAGFDLVVPAWVARGEPTDGEMEVREIDRSEMAVRIRFRHDGVLRGGGSWAVTQPVSEAVPAAEGRFRSRVVRGWLVDADGHAFTGSVTATLGRGRDGPPTATPDGIGPARLGAEVDALREAVASRDTAWTDGEEPMEGLEVEVAEGLSVLAAVAEGTVVRVRLEDPRVLTTSGAHPGMDLADLRVLFGDPCLVPEAGRTVAIFPSKGGMEFVLDGEERVSHILVRRTARDCPVDQRVPASSPAR